ncbi:MAG: adenylate/guanylate cyclase domain-containing protein [Acidobacteriota bacterium]
MSANLRIRNKKTGQQFEYPLSAPEVRIGRAIEFNQIVLNDEKVSRWHASIRRVGGNFILNDLNSANGTLINGKRITELPLKDNDTITIGTYELFFAQDLTASMTIHYEENPQSHTIFLRAPSDILSALAKQPTSPISQFSTIDDLLKEIELLKRKGETLSHIYHLNRLLNSVFSLDDIFNKLSEMIFSLTPADRFFVLIKDADSGEFSPSFANFKNRETKGGNENLYISKTVLEQVLSEKISFLSTDAQTDTRLAQTQSLVAFNIHSIICAPLLSQSNLLGVIYIDCNNPLKILGEDELELLNALAATASMAIDNAASHERLLKETLARAAYSRFMPEHVVNEILASPDAFSLGGKNQIATILFSDIRGFTTMSENLPPESLIKMLNQYFSAMTPIVFRHQGLLDKYIGDGIMALFGVPYELENSAISAVQTAIEMQQAMRGLNEEFRQSGFPPIAIGIGINTGKVTVGYTGSEQRADYTAIGDAVNLSARLEKEAKPNQIIVSHSTLLALANKFASREIGEKSVKGKKQQVRVYEILWQ